MTKTAKIIWFSIGSFLILALMVYLVWGGTIRMAYANHQFHDGKYGPALKIYEDMAVDDPKSPYISHNQALPHYQQEDYQKAIEGLKKADELLTPVKLNPQAKNRFSNHCQYHLGNSFFKLASKAEDDKTHGMYGNALESYRKAIEADPNDRAAKYNYELARIRLKSEPQQQKPEPQNDAENLLNQAKQDEQFKIQVPITDTPVDKDW